MENKIELESPDMSVVNVNLEHMPYGMTFQEYLNKAHLAKYITTRLLFNNSSIDMSTQSMFEAVLSAINAYDKESKKFLESIKTLN